MSNRTCTPLRVIVCVFRELFSAAASTYARYLCECDLSFTTASHNHSWLPLIVPETLVVSVQWSMNMITCMTGLHQFINPRRMCEGYCSCSVCLSCLSVTTLTATYLICESKLRCYKVPYGVPNASSEFCTERFVRVIY